MKWAESALVPPASAPADPPHCTPTPALILPSELHTWTTVRSRRNTSLSSPLCAYSSTPREARMVASIPQRQMLKLGEERTEPTPAPVLPRQRFSSWHQSPLGSFSTGRRCWRKGKVGSNGSGSGAKASGSGSHPPALSESRSLKCHRH